MHYYKWLYSDLLGLCHVAYCMIMPQPPTHTHLHNLNKQRDVSKYSKFIVFRLDDIVQTYD